VIATVLLAAGAARRFDGSQKLLAELPVDGGQTPLLRHTAQGLLEAGLSRLVVVIGRDADAVRRSLAGLELRFVTNPGYASGISSSVCAGVTEAMRLWPEAAWLSIALGDQPLGRTGVVETLVRVCANAGTESNAPRIIAPRFRGNAGNPVFFASELAPELLALSGDRGARRVVERDPARVRYVDFDIPAPLDVNTVEDLATLRESEGDA
jgi:molybdenum cofactor cytidylyltransferase